MNKVRAQEARTFAAQRNKEIAADRRQRKAELRDGGRIQQKRLSLHIRKIVDSIDKMKEDSMLSFFDQEFQDRIDAAAAELDEVREELSVAGF